MVKSPGLSTSATIIFSPIIQHPLPAPNLPVPLCFLPNVATKTLSLLPDPLAFLDLFSDLGDGSLLLSSKQLVLSLTFLSNAALVPIPVISLLPTLNFCLVQILSLFPSRLKKLHLFFCFYPVC